MGHTPLKQVSQRDDIKVLRCLDLNPNDGMSLCLKEFSVLRINTQRTKRKEKTMNRNIIVAAALAVFAIAATVVLCAAPELALAKLVGKAAWYVPYAALVGAVRVVRLGV